MLLEGIFLPLTTPFRPEGRLYLPKLEYNVDRYSRTPAAGMHILGANGEADGLTDHEACEVLGTAIAAAAKEKVMIAGVGRESVFATLALVEAAAAAGYDAVSLGGPAFAQDGGMRLEVVTYFQAVADRSPLPVVLVSRDGRELGTELIGELAGHPQVIGVIDDSDRVGEIGAVTTGVSREVEVTTVFAAATGRMSRKGASGDFVSAASLGGGTALTVAAGPAIKTRRKKVGFQVLAGKTAGMLGAWENGAVGAVPRLGAAAPQACCEVFQAWKDQDPELARVKQERVLEVAGRMEGFGGVAWSKYGADWNGYFGGRVRLPLLGLTGEKRGELEEMLGGMRN
ncbi:dihydrodipicolinate synthase family protein [Granulicella tundricola]|uniref:Dihydrodipicolinate synthetase n=1 Tax=Granulicella tundricola (strain ATCC BAA-1859 / DSM 23138 / MP5ACTX9) TaxID=1198114 RepID=E8WXL8_GRATM|nr:dihydrodipicolinate synthase family protein [Granulicella tundricola]ADW68634.1 dihydrodipicolinate synthetase [Granulicella tundricola MP5ACTX9]